MVITILRAKQMAAEVETCETTKLSAVLKLLKVKKVVSVNVDVTFIKAHRIVGMMHAAHYTLVVARGSRLRR